MRAIEVHPNWRVRLMDSRPLPSLSISLWPEHVSLMTRPGSIPLAILLNDERLHHALTAYLERRQAAATSIVGAEGPLETLYGLYDRLMSLA